MLQGRPVIATPVVSDAALIEGTVGDYYADMSPSNLATPQPTNRYRHKDDDGYITIDFAAPATIQLVWLGYTNATAAATWRVRGNTTASMTTPAYDSGSILQSPSADLVALGWQRRHCAVWIDAAIALRYWRIDFDNVGSAEGYFEAGRLYMSGPPESMWRPSRGIDFGWSLQLVDPTRVSRSLGSSLYPQERRGWHELAIRLSFVSEEELDENAERIERLRGASRDILIIAEPTDQRLLMRRSVYGRMKGVMPSVNQKLDYFRKGYIVEEWEQP